MKLSILICSLPNRIDLLNELIGNLAEQIKQQGVVEIIFDDRPKGISTGAKRQSLLEKATGEYIVFIDDDDEVAEYYVEEMLKAIESGADCIAINGTMTTDGRHEIAWYLSKDNENANGRGERGQLIYLRKTNHITAVRRELALQAGFPDKSNAEDKYYSDRVAPLCKTEVTIEKPMYHYRYSTQNKEYK